jgi:Uma2 family endonuclease
MAEAAGAAPELWIEIRSPSNTDEEMALKMRHYLEAGASQAWVVDEGVRLIEQDGGTKLFDATGNERTAAGRRSTDRLDPYTTRPYHHNDSAAAVIASSAASAAKRAETSVSFFCAVMRMPSDW